MVATGRAHWLAAVFAAMLPFLRMILTVVNHVPLIKRLLDLMGGAQASANPAGAQTSTVESRFLSMSLNHETGEMNGEVLQGQFTGRPLEELKLEELMQLFAECQEDEESAALLESYLDRVYADQWRQQDSQNTHGDPVGDGGDMSHEEALDILGLSSGASEEEIIDAHRRLIQNLHPDRGGSAYLAAKINKAKDILLES